uniref:Uncharacterized protein n=1 Tax=Arundo donax TaxID=35708 RepID=A0A0A9GIR1_ARUDO
MKPDHHHPRKIVKTFLTVHVRCFLSCTSNADKMKAEACQEWYLQGGCHTLWHSILFTCYKCRI